MLVRLFIADYLFIHRLELIFGSGLIVFTGETGAGKSILIRAIAGILGEKLGKEVVASAATKTQLEAEFTNCSPAVSILLAEQHIDEDNRLYISREIYKDGHSVYRVNGTVVSPQIVKQLSVYLLDIYGQNQAQRILEPSYQLTLFDNYLGKAHLDLLASFKSIFLNLNSIDKTISDMQSQFLSEEDLRHKRWQLSEIESANLDSVDEEALHLLYKQIQDKTMIDSLSHTLIQSLDSAQSGLAQAKRSLDELSHWVSLFKSISDRVDRLVSEASDIHYECSRNMKDVFSESVNSENIEQQLHQIDALKRSYGPMISDVLKYRDQLRSDIDSALHHNERLLDARHQRESLFMSCHAAASALSAQRRESLASVNIQMNQLLEQLNMVGHEFMIDCDSCPLSLSGIDRLQFRLKLGSQGMFLPLAKIASGGELSRIMLSLKTIFCQAQETMIFDEIDAGIGGKTAQRVAELLADLAENKQVFVITHLAQLASRAQQHYFIEKVQNCEVINFSIFALTGDQRRHEIARMLSGDVTVSALQHASQLLGDILS